MMFRLLMVLMLFGTSLSASVNKSWWTVSRITANKHVSPIGEDDFLINKKYQNLYKKASPIAADKNNIVTFTQHNNIPNAVMVKVNMHKVDVSYKGWEWKWFFYDKGEWISAIDNMNKIPGYEDTIMAFGINPKWKPNAAYMAYNYPYNRFGPNAGPVYEMQEREFVECEWKQKPVETLSIEILKSLPKSRKEVVFANGILFWEECKRVTKKIKVKVAE